MEVLHLFEEDANNRFCARLADQQPAGSTFLSEQTSHHQPARSTFLSEQTSHHQPASGTFLSEQTSTSHQPPANRTCCLFFASAVLKLELNCNHMDTYKRVTKGVFDMGQKPIDQAPQSSATCLISIALLLSLPLQVQNPFSLLARAARSPASFPESQVVAEPSWPI
jgi:hypothetical protein